MKEKILKKCEQVFSLSTFFLGREDNLFKFKVKDGNEITFLFEITEPKPDFFFIVTLLADVPSNNKFKYAGHFYSNRALCHNFTLNPFEIKDLDLILQKLRISIIAYIKSLSSIKNKFNETRYISNIDERDLVEMEFIHYGAAAVLLNASNELVKNPEILVGKYLERKGRAPKSNVNIFNYNKNLNAHWTSIFKNNSSIYKVQSLNIKKGYYQLENNLKNKMICYSPIISTNNNIIKKKKHLNITLIGLGSIGSFILRNMNADPHVSTIILNDGDLFSLKNRYRHAFISSAYYMKKSEIAEFLLNTFWKSITLINNMKFEEYSKRKVKCHSIPLGASVNPRSLQNLLNDIENETDIIIDATGSSEVFSFLAETTTKRIFKVGLYQSGNCAIFGLYNPNTLAKDFNDQWESKREEKGWKIDSAYNTNDPADFNRTSIAGSLFYKWVIDNVYKEGKKNDFKIKAYDFNEILWTC